MENSVTCQHSTIYKFAAGAKLKASFCVCFSQVQIQGSPWDLAPPTLGFEAPKLSIFGSYLIFLFFWPSFAQHIISLIKKFSLVLVLVSHILEY